MLSENHGYILILDLCHFNILCFFNYDINKKLSPELKVIINLFKELRGHTK